jgi:1,4-alpha-glucan branching enzyme
VERDPLNPAKGYLSLVLHAHLPYVRHPEHDRFLEENWLFEAITETYLPLLQLLEDWRRNRLPVRLTLTLTPTLCSMLRDPLLQQRYTRRLEELMELAEREVHRTHWQPAFQQQAIFYLDRFRALRSTYEQCGGDLVAAFRGFQDGGEIEIITCSATHAVLPLLAQHPPSVRAQVLVARDHYRSCFGRDPRGIWLPECAYVGGLEKFPREAGIRWFIVESHGILHARPRPRYAMFAPLLTRNGVAAFGRDAESARQVWSRHGGYPGDPRYREFYRDIGFDLDLDYLRPYLSAGGKRGFTGIKYYRITGDTAAKQPYERGGALRAADDHASHFLTSRVAQVQRLAAILDRPPLVLAPYDAELFGHWWYEGPEFLNFLIRKTLGDQNTLALITPEEYLARHPVNQVAAPAASSWGEEGYWRVWLNEKNEWIHRHLIMAGQRMTELVGRFPQPGATEERALKQAARELLLAQASDWPFIIRAGTSPDYAKQRVKDHLLRFSALHTQLLHGRVDENALRELEWKDNLFPDLDHTYFREIQRC